MPTVFESVKLDQLLIDANNVRLHPVRNIEQIKESLQRFGQQKPIVVNRNNVILAGNGTYEAARQLGWEEIQVRWTDLEGDEAKAFAIADNRASETSEFDPMLLENLLKDLEANNAGLSELWFSTDELTTLLDAIAKEPKIYGNQEDVPELPTIAVSKYGELWKLGIHRVLCGDSTIAQNVGRLMSGYMADMIWTDPPYGIDIGAKNRKLNWFDASKGNKTSGRVTSQLKNDKIKVSDLYIMLEAAFNNALMYCEAGGEWYVASSAGTNAIAFYQVLNDLKIHHQDLIWLKDHFSMALPDTSYHQKHELILYGWKPGAPHRYYGGHKQTTVWEFDKPLKSGSHPTMKPVDLIAQAIENSSKVRENVLDMFLGSGSTLIAAEKLGRRCFGLEIEPRYIDVILDRWADFTSEDPIREDGQSWAALKAASAAIQ